MDINKVKYRISVTHGDKESEIFRINSSILAMMMSIKIDNMGISRIFNKDITYIHMDINTPSHNQKVSYLSYPSW